MPEQTRDQRFLPCLLDRLRDDEPRNSEESRTQRVMSIQRYKEAVVRDLRWLLNANSHLAVADANEFNLSDYPEAFRSVLNYGTRQLSGLTAPDMEDLEQQLAEAIQTFEPRFIRHTLKVKATKERHLISFEMRAELWAEPISEQLMVKTVIDLETGQCTFGDAPNG